MAPGSLTLIGFPAFLVLVLTGVTVPPA